MSAQIDPKNSLNAVRRRPELDLSSFGDLTPEQCTSLTFLVQSFRHSQERAAKAVYEMTNSLHQMSMILGARYYRFAREYLGLQERTVRRYESIHELLSKYFIDEDSRIVMDDVSRISHRAMNILVESQETEVIEEIRQLASAGTHVTDAVVRNLLESRAKEGEAKIAAIEAGAELERKRSQEQLTELELETHRLKDANGRKDEQLVRVYAQLTALEEENEELQKNQKELPERLVEVPVVPEEYATVNDAVKAAEQQLSHLQSATEKAQKELGQVNSDLDQAKSALIATNVSMASVVKLKEDVNAILLRTPATLVKALAEQNPQSYDALASLAESLLMLANHIRQLPKPWEATGVSSAVLESASTEVPYPGTH